MRPRTLKDLLKRYITDMRHKLLKRHKKIIINDVLAFTIPIDIINNHNLQSIDEYRQRHD